MDTENFILQVSYKYKLKCVNYQKMYCTKTYKYDMDMCNIGILPQTGRYLTTVKYQLLLPITNKLDNKIIAKIYLFIGVINLLVPELFF